MKPKRIDTLTNNFVGWGEDAAYEILQEWFKGKDFSRWVAVSSLLAPPYYPEILLTRHIKETIDIVIYTMPILCIRIQGKDHKGRIKSLNDQSQESLLRKFGPNHVIDVWFDDCPTLFQDIVNEKSKEELKFALSEYGITVKIP